LLTLAALEPERVRSQADFLWLSLVSWFTDACFLEAVAKKIEILPTFLILAFQCKNQRANNGVFYRSGEKSKRLTVFLCFHTKMRLKSETKRALYIAGSKC
jgi:hypothetical protein